MNKLEEYLNSLKAKEVIYLFLSIPIVVFIFYYNFVYPKMNDKIASLQKKEKAQQKKLIKTAMAIRKIKLVEKTLRPTEKKLDLLKEDFKYIKYNIYSMKLLNLNNNRTYLLLSKLLNKSKLLHLHASFKINWNTIFKPFTKVLAIEIDGNGNFVDIIKYLQYIENMEIINHISNISISSNKNMNKTISSIKPSKTTYFNIKLTIMGVK